MIAEAVDVLEARFPQITDLSTQGHLRVSELRLQKEIKGIELQIREVEARLEEKIKGVEIQIKQVEVNLHKAMAAYTRWLLGGLAVLGAVLKLADLLIGP